MHFTPTLLCANANWLVSQLTILQNPIFHAVSFQVIIPAWVHLLKVNHRNTRTKFETCLKLTIKRHLGSTGLTRHQMLPESFGQTVEF